LACVANEIKTRFGFAEQNTSVLSITNNLATNENEQQMDL
jgi:hypothetical protein